MKMCKFTFQIKATKKGVLTPFTGPQIQALFLNIIAKQDKQLAEKLHQENILRPYAVQPLKPLQGKKKIIEEKWIIEEGQQYSFTISTLTEELTKTMIEILAEIQQIEIGKIPFDVLQVQIESKTYETLLKESFAAPKIQMEFLTPTHFRWKEAETYLPFPLPHLFYTNLARIWNMFHPYKADLGELKIWTIKNVYVKSFKGGTREIQIKGTKQTGYKGKIEYIIKNPERGYAKWATILTKYAEYTNVGAHRTQGMGVVKTDMQETKKSRQITIQLLN